MEFFLNIYIYTYIKRKLDEVKRIGVLYSRGESLGAGSTGRAGESPDGGPSETFCQGKWPLKFA